MEQTPTAIVVRETTGRAYLPSVSPEAIEQAMAIGDLSQMSNEVRVAYYVATCQSAGLNPMTRPFDLIKGDDGAVRMYPNKVAAEQLRKIHRVSNRVVERRMDAEHGLYFVTVQASTPDGRMDEAQGIVDIFQKKGVALANALMRGETKAKRRATLSLCGLGFDDSEDAGGHPVRFDYQHGEILQDGAMQTPPRGKTPLKELSDDLYGEPRDTGSSPVQAIPNFARQGTDKAFTPPPLTKERVGTSDATPGLPGKVDACPVLRHGDDIPEPDDNPAQRTGGESFIDQITAVMRAHGESDGAIAEYWHRTARRCKVSSAVAIKAAWLPKLLDERREYYAKRKHENTPVVADGPLEEEPTDWREALTATQAHIQDAEILGEIWDALNSDETPEDIGQAVLARATAHQAIMTTTVATE